MLTLFNALPYTQVRVCFRACVMCRLVQQHPDGGGEEDTTELKGIWILVLRLLCREVKQQILRENYDFTHSCMWKSSLYLAMNLVKCINPFFLWNLM